MMDDSVLRSPAGFGRDWLAEGGKLVVPVPMGGSDLSAVVGYAAACRRAGHVSVFVVPTGAQSARAEELRLPAPGDEPGWAGVLVRPCLLTSPDRRCALLVTGRGYGLLAGASDVLAAAFPHGVDTARVGFARYARRARTHRDELVGVAGEFPGRQVSGRTPADLDPAVGAGRQLRLMREFTGGALPGFPFLTGWMAARRASQEAGERLGGALAAVLDETFFLLERYEVSPELAEPGDLTEDELRSAVGEVLLSNCQIL